MTEVLLSERARDRLANFDREQRERVTDTLRSLNPDRDLTRLSGADVYRCRVGDSRFADWDRTNDTGSVLPVEYRRNDSERD